jgi:hypothetical protein
VPAVLRGAVAGTVAGAALTATLVTAGVPDHERAPRQVASVEAFLSAWERSRSLPVVVEGRYRREVGGSVVIDEPTFLAQRPPDELRVTGGDLVAVLNGVGYRCTRRVDEEVRCATSGPAHATRAVHGELEAFRSHLGGPDPDYRVTVEAGCYVLVRRRAMAAPPLRDRATYCFDEEGVLVRAQLADDAAVDIQVAGSIRPVTGADLRLPAPAG